MLQTIRSGNSQNHHASALGPYPDFVKQGTYTVGRLFTPDALVEGNLREDKINFKEAYRTPNLQNRPSLKGQRCPLVQRGQEPEAL